MSEKVTLADLTSDQASQTPVEKPQYEAVDISQIAKIEKVDPREQAIAEEFAILDESMERVKKELKENIIDPAKEAIMERAFEEQLEADMNDSTAAADRALAALDKAEGFDAEEDAFMKEIEAVKPTIIVQKEEVPVAEEKRQVIETIQTPDPVVVSVDNNPHKTIPIIKEENTEVPAKIESSLFDETPDELDSEIENAIIDADIEDIEDIDDEELENRVAHLKDTIKSKIKVFSDEKDISAFKIRKKPISYNKIAVSAPSVVKAADTVLLYKKTNITVSELSGPEISTLDLRNASQSNRLNAIINMLKTIYNHVIDPNKPTFENWMKCIPIFDLNSVYWAVYKGCFSDSNYIIYNCEHCKNVDMELFDINKMEVIDEDVKELYEKIKTGKIVEDTNTYDSTLKAINANYAFEFKVPSVYDIMYEQNAINDEQFLAKYAQTISLMAYIDAVYYIDDQNKELIPIDLKADPNNALKSIRNKVRIYDMIINKLATDEYNTFAAEIQTINKTSTANKVSYVRPSMVCGKCKKTLPELPMGPLELLFTRHQLVSIAIS